MDLTIWQECSNEAQNKELQTAFKKKIDSELKVLEDNKNTISAESRKLEDEANKD